MLIVTSKCYWQASKASETLSEDDTTENQGYLFIHMFELHMSFLYFDPCIFVLARWPTLLNSFVSAVKTYKLTGVYFIFELVVVVN